MSIPVKRTMKKTKKSNLSILCSAVSLVSAKRRACLLEEFVCPIMGEDKRALFARVYKGRAYVSRVSYAKPNRVGFPLKSPMGINLPRVCGKNLWRLITLLSLPQSRFGLIA